MPTPSARDVPACALALIQRFEGLHDGDRKTAILEPRPDPVGIYTVGWGHALFVGGRPVKDRETAYRLWRTRWPGGMIRADADALLKADAQGVCDKVAALFLKTPLSDVQLGALTSLAYNIGVAALESSSVRRRLVAGDVQGAADAFRMWRYAGGRELPGLVNRREAERAVFLGREA
uniref:lysozyme n=1 Tax=uncultured Caulobacter sp. TaxID=158749 RepID=UPI0025D26AA8|nr:lysozyme [uncultured Caulobacter sp.]